MLKVAYVSTYPPTHCGIAEYTKMLATALKSILPQSNVFILSDVESGDERLDHEAQAKVYPAFEKRATNYSKLLDILAEIGTVDILHIQHEYGVFGDTKSILEAAIEARKEKLTKGIVFTMHTVYHPLSGRVEALKFQKELSLADAVIVHSFLQEFEIQHQGVDPLIIYRIPHGTLLNPYLGTPRFKLIEELRIVKNEIAGLIMVIPGFLRKDKGLDILVEALEPLGKERVFTVIVAGELRDRELLEVIEEAQKKVNLIFIERYLTNEEMLKLVALADAILLPYRDKLGVYSVSGILHLSMGSLKPIVGTRAPRLIELYQYVPRLTVPPRKPMELTKKIKWLMENYDYAVAYMTYLYGYAARTHWLRMARRHINLYNEILQRK